MLSSEVGTHPEPSNETAPDGLCQKGGVVDACSAVRVITLIEQETAVIVI